MRIRASVIGSIGLCVGLALLVGGCGDGGPPMGKVSGTVTLDGQPLAGAEVEFAPQAEDELGKPVGVDASGIDKLCGVAAFDRGYLDLFEGDEPRLVVCRDCRCATDQQQRRHGPDR